MTDHLDALQADITFLKELAQDGREPARLGGAILIAAGLIFAGASVAQWAILAGLIEVTPWSLPAVWLAAIVVFFLAVTALHRRFGRTGASANAGRAVQVAWRSAGWTIFALAAAIAILTLRTRSPVPILLMPSIVLSLYGLAWSVMASVTGRRWIRATAAAAFIAAVAIAAVGGAGAYLAFAGALVLLATLPGVALVRQARAA